MVGLIEILSSILILILLYLFYYHMVIKYIDREIEKKQKEKEYKKEESSDMQELFEFYMNNSNEFQGDYPDTFEQFIIRCNSDKRFIKMWSDKFYRANNCIRVGKSHQKTSK